MTTTRRTVSGSEAVPGTGSGSMSIVLALLAFSVFINYIDRGSFTVAGGNPGMKVSWQVTARRNDAYMKAHRHVAEQDKPERERGYYKQRRNILNDRGQVDDIVGTETIRSLDLDLQPAKPKVQPSPTPPMPKKPGVFPKPDGPGCVKDENCPTSQSFTVKVLTIVTAGEFLEGAVAQFRFRGTQNLLTADYEWTAFGVGPPGPPLNANVGGAPAPFTTRSVRITRFGPTAIVIGGNPVPIHGNAKFLLPHAESSRGRFRERRPTIRINTGQNPLAGGGAHKGTLKLLTTCRFAPGAFLGLSRPLAL
jgi:hypothetical protein